MDPTPPLSVRLRIDFGRRSALGPGKIALLEAIARTGSLSHAATQLGMSYRRAWALLRDLNREFGAPVAIASVGGAGGGGAELTAFARELIAAYRAVEGAASAAARKHFAEVSAGGSQAMKPARGTLRRAIKKTRRGGRRAAKPR